MFNLFKKKEAPTNYPPHPIIFIHCRENDFSLDWVVPSPQFLTKGMADGIGKLISNSGYLGIALANKIQSFCEQNQLYDFWLDIEHAADMSDIDVTQRAVVPAGKAFRGQ